MKRIGLKNILHIMDRMTKAPVEGPQLIDLKLAPLAALHSMTVGVGSETAWNTLAVALNVAMILAENGVMEHALQVVYDAQDALVRSKLINQVLTLPPLIGGDSEDVEPVISWGLRNQRFAVSCGVAVYSKQMEVASRAQVLAAIEEVYRRNG